MKLRLVELLQPSGNRNILQSAKKSNYSKHFSESQSLENTKDDVKAEESHPTDSYKNFQKSYAKLKSHLGICFSYSFTSRLKYCSDMERKQCAQFMISKAIEFPEKAKMHAAILSEIATKTFIPSTQKQKSLFEHINILLANEVNAIQNAQTFTATEWQRAANIGIFLAESYNINVIKQSLMFDCLNNIARHIEEQQHSKDAFVKVFKTAQDRILKLNQEVFRKYRAIMLKCGDTFYTER